MLITSPRHNHIPHYLAANHHHTTDQWYGDGISNTGEYSSVFYPIRLY